MTIINKTPVPLADIKDYIKDLDDKKPLEDYLKKFSKTKKEKAHEIIEGVRALDNPKIKETDLVKIADFSPTTIGEVNKIFTELNLTEDEANAILDIIKK